jgi:TonB family protein
LEGISQERVREYFDRDGHPSDEKSAYYFTVGKKTLFLQPGNRLDTVASYVDTLFSFYVQENKIRSKEIYNADGFLNGRYIRYYANGKVQERGLFYNGRPVGFFMYHHLNGKIRMIRQYFEEAGAVSQWPPLDYKLIMYSDSSGNVMVNNGNGFCRCSSEDYTFVETGLVKAGVRDSLWREFKNDTLVREEQFKNGVLIKGKRYDKKEVVEYNEFEILPEYKEGMQAMVAAISKNLRYPMQARRLGIEGTVQVSFIVHSDGTASDHKIVKGIDELNAEALRVATLLKDWSPGIQHGRKVNVRLTVPVRFKLGQ